MTRHALLDIAIAALLVVTPTSSQSGAAGTALQRRSSAGADFVYPLPGTVFPPELPPPEFIWRCDAEAVPDRWTIQVRCPNLAEPMVFESARPRWRPPPEAWRRIKALSTGAEATVTVLGAASAGEKRGHSDFPAASMPHGRPIGAMENQNVPFFVRGHTRFTTAADPVGAPILYRSVPLPFIEAVKHPERVRWRLLNVGADGPPPVVLENLPVCGNCHSADAGGRVLGLDVDYANDKGSYAIIDLAPRVVLSREALITWSDYRRDPPRRDDEPTFGLLSRLSPDGRYVVSTVKDRSVFVPRPDLAYSQLFFPVKGILAFYDRGTGRFASLPGADDPRYVQTAAEWSPDGQWVTFCRAEAARIPESAGQRHTLITHHLAREFLDGKRPFRFDLYRVAFRGGAGGQAVPLPGASANGRSNYFPRTSPDGQWLVFCQAADFMLLQPDSRLYIMSAQGGRPRPMTCNTDRMNSWHAWSPNGRWLVFATKLRGPYTQLCLTHVDEAGNDSPPVLLEHAMLPERACNIPEFLNLRPGAELAIRVDFLDSHNYRRQGQVLLGSGDAAGAVPLFEKALALDGGDHDARLRLAAALAELGRFDRAQAELTDLLDRLGRGRPPDAERLYQAHCHAAALCRRTGRLADAADHYRRAASAKPQDVDARILLALVHAAQAEFGEAHRVLAEAADLKPTSALVRMWLGQVLADQGRHDEAIEQFRRALGAPPHEREDWLLVARRAARYADLVPDIEAFVRTYLRRFGPSAEAHTVLAEAYLRAGRTEDARNERAAARAIEQRDRDQD